MSKAKSLICHSIITEKAEDVSLRNEFVYSVQHRDLLQVSFPQAWRLCTAGLPLEDRKNWACSKEQTITAESEKRTKESEQSPFLALNHNDCPTEMRTNVRQVHPT